MINCWCGCETEPQGNGYAACVGCGTFVCESQPSDDEIKKLYGFQSYWQDNMKKVGQPVFEQRAVNDLNDRIPHWWNRVKETPNLNSLLEIGCAHGGFLRYAFQNGVKHCFGFEPDAITAQKATGNGAEVFPETFPENQIPPWPKALQAVCAFDVLEHSKDPLRFINAAADLLVSNGRLFIQTPWYRNQGLKWEQFKPKEHLFIFTSEAIHKLLSVCGLDRIGFEYGIFPGDMFVIGKKA